MVENSISNSKLSLASSPFRIEMIEMQVQKNDGIEETGLVKNINLFQEQLQYKVHGACHISLVIRGHPHQSRFHK